MHDDQDLGHPDDDPLKRLQRREYSWRPAVKYAGAVIGATFLTAIIIGVISAVMGGPICDAGEHVFICSRWAELAFPLVPGAVSLIGALGCFWITYLRWRSFGNWRPAGHVLGAHAVDVGVDDVDVLHRPVRRRGRDSLIRPSLTRPSSSIVDPTVVDPAVFAHR